MTAEDEQELSDDVRSALILAAQGINYKTKRIGDLRELHMRIYSILKPWVPREE